MAGGAEALQNWLGAGAGAGEEAALTTNLQNFLSSMRAEAISKSSLTGFQQPFSFLQYSCSSRVVMLELGLRLLLASAGTAPMRTSTRAARLGAWAWGDGWVCLGWGIGSPEEL